MDQSPAAAIPASAYHTVPHSAAVCGPACGPKAAIVPHVSQSFGQQVTEFFSRLFNTDNWPARWHCGTWTDFHGWLYIIADLLIWASYFAIPFLLIKMVTKRKDIPFPKIIWLFIAFIVLCGTTHLLDAIIFWWPAYRLSALIRILTGLVSAVTVYALYKVMPLVMSLRSVKELEHEIKERKAVEAKLEASQFLLNEASRIGRMGAWEYDCSTKRSTWSPVVYDIYEVTHDYIIDEGYSFNFYPEPYKQQLMDAIDQAYLNGTGWDLELQMITAKGANIWVRSCGEVFYDENGHISKLRGMFMDIDKYKTNEQALNRSHELLFQSHQQLKTFTHILSHNIRNHSSNISLLTDLMDQDTLDENNADLFDKIVKVSRGLNATLNDLAEAIKIRESSIEPEVVSFRGTAERTIEILESEILSNGARVIYDFEVETVVFPKLYLESVLINLVSNAIKYRREDVPPEVTLRTYLDNGKVVLECQDNGLGIDMELHGNRLFGLYKTFHVHKDAHGVGLFLVKTQVESQGGAISVVSQPGKGSTFIIKF